MNRTIHARSRDPRPLLEKYKRERGRYDRLAKLVAQFLEWRVQEIFPDARLRVLHVTESRAKSLESLDRNLRARRYKENVLERIGDLAGARLIFHFEDDLETFCSTARFSEWFGKYSGDHLRHVSGELDRKGRRQDLPGYDSFHVPVCVTPNTGFWRSLEKHDQQLFNGLYCEVQLRTIVRHAWAEAEHDLRYKLKRLRRIQLTEEQNHMFRRLADDVKDIDGQLKTLKGQISGLIQTLEGEKPTRVTSWEYLEPVSPPAYQIGGVKYDYEVLHMSVPGRGRDTVLKIDEFHTMFDLDSAMLSALDVHQFKQKMWARLKAKEPAFMATIHYDTVVVRALGWDDRNKTIKVQPARYSDQVVTNHKKALLTMIPGRRRVVRELAYDKKGKLLSLQLSPLSNTMGVACVVTVDNGRYWVIALRSQSLAFDPGTWGCPVSGALEWTELGYWDRRDFEGWFKAGMAREFEQELHYGAKLEDLHYLGFARELGRAGKPQVFFYLDVKDLSCNDLQSLWRTYSSPSSEYQEVATLDTEAVLDLVSADQHRVQKHIKGAGLNEELRMNLALALQYLGRLH
jgi:ppGpp synthetase/RelA/SpoT-type nucleotidyltranferase